MSELSDGSPAATPAMSDLKGELLDLLEARTAADPENRRRIQARIRELQARLLTPEDRQRYREAVEVRKLDTLAAAGEQLWHWIRQHGMPRSAEAWDQAHRQYLEIPGWAEGELLRLAAEVDALTELSARTTPRGRLRLARQRLAEIEPHLPHLARHVDLLDLDTDSPTIQALQGEELERIEQAKAEAARERAALDARAWLAEHREAALASLLELQARSLLAGVELPLPPRDALDARVRELING